MPHDSFPIGVRRTLEEVLAAHPLPLKNPDGSPSELTAMQKEDAVKLADLQRVLGDLPVGYGKTALATAMSLMLGAETTVILMPPILVPQWVEWLESVPGAGRVLAYEGTPKKREKFDLSGVRWLPMSYQVFNNDIDRLCKELSAEGRFLVVDEAQNMKGRGVLWRNIKAFSPWPAPLLTMSGTIMSKPGDGYAYIKLNTPKVYDTYAVFESVHVLKRDFFKNPVEWHNLDLLHKNLDLARVRRTKEEVHANLPTPNFIVQQYDLHPEHMKLYQELMDKQLLEVGDGKIDATTAGALYSASQQIIANWGYFSDDESNVPRLFEMLDNLIDEIGLGDPVMEGDPPRSKLIIWTIFQRTSARVHAFMNERLKAKGKYASAAYGKVDSRKGVEQFMKDPNCVAGVFQPGSVGAGLNPQSVCWEMFFAESPTTTIRFIQAVGRVWRQGQIYHPNIRLAVARRTIQQSMLKQLYANDALVVAAGGAAHKIEDLFANSARELSGYTKQAIKDLIFPK